MTEEQASRFKDAPWFPKKEVNCIVGGAGGIGSWLTMLLTRASIIPSVYDFDTIEEHNIGGQLYSKKDINSKKVVALKEFVKDYSDTDIYVMDERYTKDSMSDKFVFSAFDNMQARKDMFEAWCNYVEENKESEESIPVYKLVLKDPGPNKLEAVKLIKESSGLGLKESKDLLDSVSFEITEDQIQLKDITLEDLQTLFTGFGTKTELVEIGKSTKKVMPIFIDGRLTAEQMQIFCVTPDKIEKYKEHLFDDSEVPDAPCTLKQTSHAAAMIASHMVGFFTNHLTNIKTGEDERAVPFYWEYFIPINYLKEQ